MFLFYVVQLYNKNNLINRRYNSYLEQKKRLLFTILIKILEENYFKTSVNLYKLNIIRDKLEYYHIYQINSYLIH